MAMRKIIKIEEDKCNGCGLCVPNCVEGAIQIINGKAKLVKDSYCDGLGACLGHCPQDALHIIEREAAEFDEEEAMKNVQKKSPIIEKSDVVGVRPLSPAHGGGCLGSRVMSFANKEDKHGMPVMGTNNDIQINIKSQLRQWPVQLKLVPVNAPYFQGADLLVTADCVPFAYANYHMELLKGKIVVVGCPKLDDIASYTEKLEQIILSNELKGITVAFMEVPCCSGIVRAVEKALQNSGKNIPLKKVRITIDGQAQS
jgi:Pyruvate/2-oxoacid:ferredoxin oxidoreductase delta subunit